jgi:hypothetical protein
MESVGVCASSGVELVMLIKSAISVEGGRGVTAVAHGPYRGRVVENQWCCIADR